MEELQQQYKKELENQQRLFQELTDMKNQIINDSYEKRVLCYEKNKNFIDLIYYDGDTRTGKKARENILILLLLGKNKKSDDYSDETYYRNKLNTYLYSRNKIKKVDWRKIKKIIETYLE